MRMTRTLRIYALAFLLSGCVTTREQPPAGEPELNDDVVTSTSPLDVGETLPPTGHELFFEGRVPAGASGLLASLPPGLFLSLPPFPIEVRDPPSDFNPLGLPRDVRARLARINSEIRMYGTDRGIVIEHRGWSQTYVATSRDSSCAVLFDFRVNVVERRMAGTTFGRIDRPFEHVQVLTPPPAGRSGLYVLVIATVEVNTGRIGDAFTETNQAIVNERASRNPPASSTVPAMPRWFIVEHELMHAEQIKRDYRAVVDKIANDEQLCRPTRPVDRHKALVEQGFDTSWQALTNGGAGGSHTSANYPNTPAETEAREAAWRLLDGRAP